MRYDQCKTCRRLGQKLFLKGERCFSQKCAMVKRAYAPVPQKKRRGGSPSAFKKSLEEKQTLKKWYGVSERQFKKYAEESLAKMGKVENIAEEFIKKLEKRLDNVIFRLGIAKSRAQARQLVSHRHVTVNNKIVKKGDIISIKENKKKKGALKDLQAQIKKYEPPVWLNLNKEELEGKAVGDPNLEEVNAPAEISSIFEFYSR